ncbi:MAG TPA: hypothetical protein VFM45_08610, partial [Anaeromyxobacteraceae bacterium]|nr:hypothetical protein [Anaeromyxobacteraceae bacterium]
MLAAALLAVALAAPPDTVAPPRAVPPPPDAIAQLVGTLARLPATTPIRARVEHKVTFRQGTDDPNPSTGSATASAAAGPDGLRISWTPATLAQAEAEERARIANPDAFAPTRDAVNDLRTLAVARSVDAVPELLRQLVEAKVLEDRPDVHEGAPARLLVLQVTPVIAARDRKYVKEVEATSRIWLGPDGVPLAEERRALAKGRIFLIIG